MKTLRLLLPTLSALTLLVLISLTFPPQQFYPLVRQVSSTSSTELLAVGYPVGTLSLCRDRAAQLAAWLHAVNTITSERCRATPDTTMAHLLGAAPLEQASLRLLDAVILAGPTVTPPHRPAEPSGADDADGNACAAWIARVNTDGRPATCFAAGKARPSVTKQPQSRMLMFSAALVGAMFLTLAGVLLAGRRRSLTARSCVIAALALGDMSLLLGALTLVTWARSSVSSGVEGSPVVLLASTVYAHALLSLVVLVWLGFLRQHYTHRRPFWDELSESFQVLTIVFLLACTLSFLVRLDAARGTLLLVWAAALALLPLGRHAVRLLLDRSGLWSRDAVIIGIGENAVDAVRALESERNLGYRILGGLPSGLPGETASLRWAITGVPQLAVSNTDPATLVSTLRQLGAPQIVIAVDSLSSSEATLLVRALALAFDGIHVIPTIRGLPLFGTSLSHFFRHEVLFLTLRNTLHQRGLQALKRTFDLLGACVLLVLLSPLFAVLAVLIVRTGASPFYSHPRVGRHGALFGCLKFRSMRPDADQVLQDLLANDPEARAEWARDFKLRSDPRVTAIGAFLRRSSLDELPQLINVVRGEMSLVGPRPVVRDELARYGEQADLYLQVRPGITGLWQVSGRNDTDYDERVALDTWYVQNWSLWYDIAILFKTIDTVAGKRGAY